MVTCTDLSVPSVAWYPMVPREPPAHGFTWSSSHESEHAWRRSGKDAEYIIAVRIG